MDDGGTCEYFTRYGNEGRPGACASVATLALQQIDGAPPIAVCHLHARTITARFPALGDVATRFSQITPPRRR